MHVSAKKTHLFWDDRSIWEHLHPSGGVAPHRQTLIRHSRDGVEAVQLVPVNIQGTLRAHSGHIQGAINER